MSHEHVFTNIYENKMWGEDVSDSFKGSSGCGSTLEFNNQYIAFLRDFIEKHNVKSVVDLGCGDWRCGRSIYENLSCSYIGYDIYEPMIKSHNELFKDSRWKFEVMNCFANLDCMANADLLIVKDVLQHWSDKEVTEFMEFQKRTKKYKYILIVNCSFATEDVLLSAGGWRTLPKNHALFLKYNLTELFKYSTKNVLLMIP